jgi:arylsulfatase A-like enzyme
VRRHYGLVTQRYKLVHFYEPDVDYWKLFDLEKDPRELHSVYGEPGYAAAQKSLRADLLKLRGELGVTVNDPPGSIIPPGPK